jgi:hypothetical protein
VFYLQDAQYSGKLPFDFLRRRCESVTFLNHQAQLGSAMNSEQSREEWFRLCEKVAVEQDPEELARLTREIYRLLEEREKSLRAGRRS